MTWDCLKYGVVFIFSTNGPNTVRYRLRQNFKQNVVLQFNDPMDYSSVIPGVRKKEPSKAYGRGLILLDSIFEFQTAYAYKEERMADYLKIICDKLNQICDYKAPRIPILPEVVSEDVVSNFLGKMSTIPIGVEKDSLDIATISLNNKFMYNITGEDISSDTSFIKGLMKNVLSVANTSCLVFDTNNILNEVTYDNTIYSKDACYEAISELEKAFDSEDESKTYVCFMISINAMLNKLSSIEKSKFTTLISNCKQKGNIKIFIIDTIDVIKSISFETWYKGNSDLSEGIWLGNGIANQFTLKVTTNSRILRAEVEPGFGYVIKKGKAVLTKLMASE